MQGDEPRGLLLGRPPWQPNNILEEIDLVRPQMAGADLEDPSSKALCFGSAPAGRLRPDRSQARLERPNQIMEVEPDRGECPLNGASGAHHLVVGGAGEPGQQPREPRGEGVKSMAEPPGLAGRPGSRYSVGHHRQ